MIILLAIIFLAWHEIRAERDYRYRITESKCRAIGHFNYYSNLRRGT